MVKFGFQKLEVYQLAKSITLLTYSLTDRFPDKERYALAQQMNRASVSIASNISEGYSRASINEKCRFMNIAYGSLMELVCQFEISNELGYIDREGYSNFAEKANGLAIKISNFTKYLKNK